MKIRLNPFILGAFILGALTLVVVGFFALGTNDLFQPSGRFIFYMPDSAQGVDVGTDVTLEGVRVGEVEKVRVLYDRPTRKALISVICKVTRNALTDFHGRKIQVTDDKVLRDLISDGMFVQVQTAGVVGSKYIELGFGASSPAIAEANLPPSPLPVVPTVPSAMSAMMKDASGILAKLRETDFPGIGKQAEDVLESAHRQIGELQTNQLTTHLSAAAASIDQFMTSAELRGTVARIEAAAAEFRNLATNVDAQVQPVAGRLDTTLATAGETAQNLRDFLTLRNQLGQQTQDLLEQFDQTARTIEQLADFLKRHPNALITGRDQLPHSP